jgi:hypothetical protein
MAIAVKWRAGSYGSVLNEMGLMLITEVLVNKSVYPCGCARLVRKKSGSDLLAASMGWEIGAYARRTWRVNPSASGR